MRALHRRALHRRGACPRRRARFTLAPLSSSRSPPLPLLSRPRKNRQNVSKPIYPVRETRLASFSPLVVSAHSRENASQQRFPTLPLRRSSAIFRKPLTSAEEHEPGWGKTRSKKYFPRVMPIKGDARSTTMALGCSLLTLKIRLSGEKERDLDGFWEMYIYLCRRYLAGVFD